MIDIKPEKVVKDLESKFPKFDETVSILNELTPEQIKAINFDTIPSYQQKFIKECTENTLYTAFVAKEFENEEKWPENYDDTEIKEAVNEIYTKMKLLRKKLPNTYEHALDHAFDSPSNLLPYDKKKKRKCMD